MKSKGPNIDPCGTPTMNFCFSRLRVFNFNDMSSIKKKLKPFKLRTIDTIRVQFFKSTLWPMVSKTFVKSKNTAPTIFPLFISYLMLSHRRVASLMVPSQSSSWMSTVELGSEALAVAITQHVNCQRSAVNDSLNLCYNCPETLVVQAMSRWNDKILFVALRHHPCGLLLEY